ncbi:MAG: MerR family transcriptional regulator [Lachnospiraceae bacterium]|nr:MerR family transcriptional regulator [Dorea sp.]MEE0738334.1 MerR family transcriptional regulator [Lachnospiraceae bacterium]
MKNNKYLFSTGEFAKLNGVNKRTLHYYNDIGLFQPEITEENGYHYYSLMQSMQLEMILLLRKLGLTIDDIREYTNSPSDDSFAKILTDKKRLINQSIEQLMEAKDFLQQKLDKLELGLSAEHGKIELVHLPERRILLSEPITGIYDEVDFSVVAEFSMRLKKLFGLYDNFGSRISSEHIMEQEFQKYDAFFSYGREDVDEYEEMRPEGDYLRTFCIGGWDKLKDVYQMIMVYAKEHGLILQGYAYEEGLNEMSLRRGDDYITMITVAVQRES